VYAYVSREKPSRATKAATAAQGDLHDFQISRVPPHPPRGQNNIHYTIHTCAVSRTSFCRRRRVLITFIIIFFLVTFIPFFLFFFYECTTLTSDVSTVRTYIMYTSLREMYSCACTRVIPIVYNARALLFIFVSTIRRTFFCLVLTLCVECDLTRIFTAQTTEKPFSYRVRIPHERYNRKFKRINTIYYFHESMTCIIYCIQRCVRKHA